MIEKSICCGAPRRVCGSDEGTYYYDCQNCGKEFIPVGTDFSPPPLKSPASEKECKHGFIVCGICDVKTSAETPDWMDEEMERFAKKFPVLVTYSLIKDDGTFIVEKIVDRFTKYWLSRMAEKIEATRKEGMNVWLKHQDLFQEGANQGRQEERDRVISYLEQTKSTYNTEKTLDYKELVQDIITNLKSNGNTTN